MSPCCSEVGCRRKKPFKIRRSGLSNNVYLVTDYGYTNEGRTMVARTKHNITEEIEAFMRSEGWTPPKDKP
jgi:hypothetical protein